MTSISASGTADSARRHPPNGHTPTPAADHLAHRSHRRVDRCVPCQHPWRGHLATCPQDPARHLGRAREDTLGMPSRYQAMVLLASWCGLRLGELTELRRSDVDLGDGVIRVRRAMVCVRGEFRVTTPNQRRTSEMSTSRRTCCRQPITWQVTSVSTRTRWYSPPGMAAIWRRARCTRPTTGGPRLWPFGHRLGGCVIHFPAVVCTNSPSTCTSLCRKRQLGPPSVGI